MRWHWTLVLLGAGCGSAQAPAPEAPDTGSQTTTPVAQPTPPTDGPPRCTQLGEGRSAVTQGLEAELLVLECAPASGPDAIVLNARIVNRGASTVTINRMSLVFRMLSLHVRDASGTEVPRAPPPVPPVDGPDWHVTLTPNADYSFDGALTDVVAIPLPPGRYEIRFDYANAAGPDWTGRVVTDWVGFTLR